jgi:hypothetical protein
VTEQVVEGEVVHEQALDRAEQIRDTLPAVRASEALVARDEITVGDVVAQREKIIAVMDAVMVEGVHYGRIPGVDKPTLLKPGAEVLAVTFRLGPFYNSERLFHDDGHLTVITKTTLRHIPTSLAIAEGEGLCTTREAKYAWRKGGLVCPDCGEPQIRKSKHDPEFYCWRKEGGCGSKFPLDDERITSQDQSSRIPNPDIADTYNTVLKIANKRALVAAILNGTAASDVFTQDVEDGGSSDSTSTAKRRRSRRRRRSHARVRRSRPTLRICSARPTAAAARSSARPGGRRRRCASSRSPTCRRSTLTSSGSGSGTSSTS